MGLEWEELSEGDWSCPRCAERKGLPTKRLTVDEVKNRQSTGAGRCVPLMSVCLSVCLCELVSVKPRTGSPMELAGAFPFMSICLPVCPCVCVSE